MHKQGRCVLLWWLWQPSRPVFQLGLTLVFEHLHGWSRNNFCGQVIPHIRHPLAEGKLAQIKPRSFSLFTVNWIAKLISAMCIWKLPATFIDSSTYRLRIFGGHANIAMSVFPKISTWTTIGKWWAHSETFFLRAHFFSKVRTVDFRQNVRGSFSGPAAYELQFSVTQGSN